MWCEYHHAAGRGAFGTDWTTAIMWFLITWATYGHWLPGDPRGFRTYRGKKEIPPPKRYAGGGPAYEPAEYKRLYDYTRARTGRAIRLNRVQIQAACDMIVETATAFGVGGVVAIGPHHVHVLASFPPAMTTGFFCNRVKSRSSLRLSEFGLRGRVWARRYHAKQVLRESIDDARKYILSHECEDTVVAEFGLP